MNDLTFSQQMLLALSFVSPFIILLGVLYIVGKYNAKKKK
jgi:hypothetical protein